MIVLSKLITHIGFRAAGRRHLVEIIDPADLAAIKSGLIDRRLIEARQALQVVKSILAHKPVPEDAVECLTRITRLPGGVDIRG